MKKLLLSLILLFSPPLYAASQSVGGQWRGLNNGDASIFIGDNESQDLSNVDLTDNASGVKKRSGYATFKGLTVSTSGVRGGYYLRSVNANNLIIHAHDKYVSKSVDGANYSNFITSSTVGAYWDFTDSQGYLWGLNSSRDILWRYDDTTVTFYPSSPQGDQLEVLPDRLAVTGTAANPNRINFSKQADFTTFTPGTNESDPWTDDVTLPGQKINCLKYALGRLIVWTRTSTLFGSGNNQFDFAYEDVSSTIGCDQPNSVLYDNGQVFWQAQDGHFYAYDGNTIRKISQQISGSASSFANGESKSWLQSAESDFELGTHADTSDDISEGDVVLSTWTDTDTTSADFGAGDTLTNVSTGIVSGSLVARGLDFLNFSFEQGTTTDANAWTESQYGTIFGRYGGTAAQAGSWVMAGDSNVTAPNSSDCSADQTGATFSVTIYDSSDNAIGTEGSYTITTSYQQKTIDLSAYSGQNIKVALYGSKTVGIGPGSCGISSQFEVARSDVFNHIGGSISFYVKAFGTGNKLIAYDNVRSEDYENPVFISRTFNTGITDPAWLASSVSYSNSSHTMAFETQSSTDGSSWDAGETLTPGSAPISAFQRYLRYKVTFTASASGTASPKLDSATFSGRAATGTFISQIKNIGTTPSSWGNFDADQTLNSGTISYFIRTASTSGGVPGASRVALTRGAQITATVNQYFRVEADLSINGTATNIPTLSNFTVNWNEGTISRTWGSVDKDHRLIWAVAEGASNVPNVSYIYDQRFDTWLKYSVPMIAPARVGNSLYFGAASAGTIYNYPSGTNDAGSAITAYWKSKDFISSDPFSEKVYKNLNLIADAQSGSNLDLSYIVNASGTPTSNSISLTDTNGIVRHNRLLPSGTFGTFFSFKFGNDDTDSPFEVYSVRYDYDLKPWRVLP